MWTYTGAPSIAGSADATAQQDLDGVRLCIGDVDGSDELLQDGEITFFMLQECGTTSGAMNIYRVASACCYQIATRFSRQADKVIGPAQLKSSQKSAQYKSRGDEWLLKSRLWSTSVYAGGISISDKEAVESNVDRVQPFFTRDMGDFPGTVLPVIDPAWQHA